MRKFLFVFVVVLIVSGVTSRAEALRMPCSPPEIGFYPADTVFLGTLVSNKEWYLFWETWYQGFLKLLPNVGLEAKPYVSMSKQRFVFSVEEVFKGAPSKKVILEKSKERRQNTDFRGVVGEKYIVFSDKTIGACWQPRPLSEHKNFLELVREQAADYRQRRIIYEAEQRAIQGLADEESVRNARIFSLEALIKKYPEPESAFRLYKIALYFSYGEMEGAQAAIYEYRETTGEDINVLSDAYDFKMLRRLMVHGAQFKIYLEQRESKKALEYLNKIRPASETGGRGYPSWYGWIELYGFNDDMLEHVKDLKKDGAGDLERLLISKAGLVREGYTLLQRFYLPLQIQRELRGDRGLFIP